MFEIEKVIFNCIFVISILKQCYIIFLEQTTNWLMNGFLVDPYGEFIIRKVISRDDSTEESDASIIMSNQEVSLCFFSNLLKFI